MLVESTRFERFFARIFLAILSLAIAFVIAELISRKFITTLSPVEQSIPVNALRHPKPYVMLGSLPDQMNLNSLGYRGPMPKMPKNPSEYRVFMLGGSTLLVGLESIAEWLQHDFVLTGNRDVRVYNFSVLSSVSGMELARIVYEISDLQPDLVIMYNGGNDIIAPWESDPRPGYPFDFVVLENNPLVEHTPQTYPSFALFAYGSNLLRFALRDYFTEHFLHLNDLRKDVNWNSTAWREKIAATYVSNVVKASKISKTFGAEFIVFFQPLVFYKKQLSPAEKQMIEGANASEAEYARDMRSRMISGLKNAAEQNTLNWRDLGGIYDKDPGTIFKDFIHTTDGNSKRVVAHTIFLEIRSMVKQPQVPR